MGDLKYGGGERYGDFFPDYPRSIVLAYLDNNSHLVILINVGYVG
jgi:hypothetical protein